MVKYVNKVIKNTIQFFVLGGDFSGYQKYTQSKLKVEILGCKEKI